MKKDDSRDAMMRAKRLVKAAIIIADPAIPTDATQAESCSDFARYCILATRAAQDYINARKKMNKEK